MTPVKNTSVRRQGNRQVPSLLHQYQRVRQTTESLCQNLEVEDLVVQSIPEASPTKWHLGHTSWFFETFILLPYCPGYRPFHPKYKSFFNSYYNTVGTSIPQAQRGSYSRPTVKDIHAYRNQVDTYMSEFLLGHEEAHDHQIKELVHLGLNHEQQHQELILTDIKHALASNPLRPAYKSSAPPAEGILPSLNWIRYEAGLTLTGHSGADFAFDNESPRHQVLLHPFHLASRLVTVGEYLQFVESGGYRQPELWLSDGWKRVQDEGWTAPLYMERNGGQWWVMTLSGFRKACSTEPVSHVSYFEADAFARWSGARLPREQEWEHAAAGLPIRGTFLETGSFHPESCRVQESEEAPAQIFGDVWEWTSSAHSPYPGYRPPEGALGEYNGKFMSNQMVLRGGSCASPGSHIRSTYRNFWAPHTRWQFSGIRLAKDGG